MRKTYYEIIGKDSKSGISARTGQTFLIESLTLNFNGHVARVLPPKDITVNIGDFVSLKMSTFKKYGVYHVGVVVEDIITKEEMQDMEVE